MLGAENIDIVTGGGPGIMQAACKGHQEGRKSDASHSIGLNIDIPAEQEPNRYLDIKKDFHRFSKRLDTFMVLSNAIVVAPGGVGTLLELAYAWQLVQVKHICNIPIILLGEMWAEFLKWVERQPLKKGFLAQKDLEHLFIAKDSFEAFRIIKRFHDGYLQGEDICYNFKKYKCETDSLLDGEKL
jgi:predicted Rossmann-fold nucleotide-binding protein